MIKTAWKFLSKPLLRHQSSIAISCVKNEGWYMARWGVMFSTFRSNSHTWREVFIQVAKVYSKQWTISRWPLKWCIQKKPRFFGPICWSKKQLMIFKLTVYSHWTKIKNGSVLRAFFCSLLEIHLSFQITSPSCKVYSAWQPKVRCFVVFMHVRTVPETIRVWMKKLAILYWLVVWSIFYFSIYWECHHPNWFSYFAEGRSTTNQL